jgi:hypothetical protein
MYCRVVGETVLKQNSRMNRMRDMSLARTDVLLGAEEAHGQEDVVALEGALGPGDLPRRDGNSSECVRGEPERAQ